MYIWNSLSSINHCMFETAFHPPGDLWFINLNFFTNSHVLEKHIVALSEQLVCSLILFYVTVVHFQTAFDPVTLINIESNYLNSMKNCYLFLVSILMHCVICHWFRWIVQSVLFFLCWVLSLSHTQEVWYICTVVGWSKL